MHYYQSGAYVSPVIAQLHAHRHSRSRQLVIIIIIIVVAVLSDRCPYLFSVCISHHCDDFIHAEFLQSLRRAHPVLSARSVYVAITEHRAAVAIRFASFTACLTRLRVAISRLPSLSFSLSLASFLYGVESPQTDRETRRHSRRIRYVGRDGGTASF